MTSGGKNIVGWDSRRARPPPDPKSLQGHRLFGSALLEKDPAKPGKLCPVRAQRGCFSFPEWSDVNQEIDSRMIRHILCSPEVKHRHGRGPQQRTYQMRVAYLRIPARIGGSRDAVDGKAADRDVIGVLVRSVRIERDQRLRTCTSNGMHDAPPDVIGRRGRELLVLIRQQ